MTSVNIRCGAFSGRVHEKYETIKIATITSQLKFN